MKKTLALILALCMVFALCACSVNVSTSSSSSTTTEAAPAEEAAAEAVEEVAEEAAPAEKKVIHVATNVAFPPYEYYEDEKAVGIDIEIMQAICDKLGYDMVIDDMEFGSVIIAVQTGKDDVGVGGITITEERKKSVDFTVPYDAGIQSIIVTEDSPIAAVENLAGDGVKIGVQESTTGDLFCTDDFGEDHVMRFNKGADAVQALITGKCTAVVIDNGPAKTFVSQNEGLTILPTAYYQEDYGFEISKDNPELYAEINGTLEEMIADGTVQAILDKYKAD